MAIATARCCVYGALTLLESAWGDLRGIPLLAHAPILLGRAGGDGWRSAQFGEAVALFGKGIVLPGPLRGKRIFGRHGFIGVGLGDIAGLSGLVFGVGLVDALGFWHDCDWG